MSVARRSRSNIKGWDFRGGFISALCDSGHPQAPTRVTRPSPGCGQSFQKVPLSGWVEVLKYSAAERPGAAGRGGGDGRKRKGGRCVQNRLPLGPERGREGERCSRPEFAGGAGAVPPGVQRAVRYSEPAGLPGCGFSRCSASPGERRRGGEAAAFPF